MEDNPLSTRLQSPLPDWIFEPLSPADAYILVTLAHAPASAYQVAQSIPYDSDGHFRVSEVGVRRALARLATKHWVELVRAEPGGRRERLYALTDMGAAQLERQLVQLRWLAAIGEDRLARRQADVLR